MTVSLMNNFLVVAVDNQVVDACVAYCQEIIKCKQQLSQDVQELKRQVTGTLADTLVQTQGSRRLEQMDMDDERQRFVMEGDFGFGCVRLCCSIDGKKLSTISATNAHGKFEIQGGQLTSQNFNVKIEDVTVRFIRLN